ncbi:MAG TPA: peptide ABC transporter substrate-binding protein [Candidatus Dormibacteraeota bacterium]|nr:peptide ABC transporter substrate-binding protein [Candidatus Dormibacteraeota bacterium]
MNWRAYRSATLIAVLALAGAASGVRPAPAAAQATSETAVVALYEEPTSLNPILGPQMDFATMVEITMFPNLFAVQPDGRLTPDLASVVPTVQNGGISKDGLTYTFHLRAHVEWSDGQPFTAQDVLKTYQLLMDPHVNALTTAGFNQVAKAEVINPLTIRFTLKQPYSPFLSTCWSATQLGIIPAHVFDKIPAAEVNKAAFNYDPSVALGPYMFESWKHGAAITVVANPHYYGKKPKLKKIVFQVMPDQNTILSSIQAGSVNLYTFVPIQQVSTLQSNPAVKVHFYEQSAWEWGQLNFKDPILQDRRVRQALEYGIDRQAIVEHVWQGKASLTSNTQIPMYWSYDPSVKPYPYDPEKAKQLLDAAGWKTGPGGVRVKDGKQLVLTYSTTAGNPWREETEQIIQQELGAVGVKIDIHNYPANIFFGNILFHGQFQIAEYEGTGGPDPDLRIYRADSCNAIPPKGSNYGSWCDKRIDPLLEAEEATTNRADRKAIFSKISKIENEEMPSLYYYSPKGIVATSHLDGFVPNGYVQPTWDVVDWTISAK